MKPSWPLLARYVLAVILLATGLAKLVDLPGFVTIVRTYDALPEPLLVAAALAVTGAELALSAWLASGIARRIAAGMSAALHLAYASWTSLALWRGLVIPNCGCFGVFFARPLSIGTLVEDGTLVALSLLAMRERAR